MRNSIAVAPDDYKPNQNEPGPDNTPSWRKSPTSGPKKVVQGNAGEGATPGVPSVRIGKTGNASVSSMAKSKPVGVPIEPKPAATKEATCDFFSPENLAEWKDVSGIGFAQAVAPKIEVCKPHKSVFVRAHPSPEYSYPVGCIELKLSGEYYFVAPHLKSKLCDDATFKLVNLTLATDRHGKVFVWPTPVPTASGQMNAWNESADAAKFAAKSQWVRVTANLEQGCYSFAVASGNLGDPAWPTEPFADILRRAFGNRVIDSMEHRVVKELRGEA